MSDLPPPPPEPIFTPEAAPPPKPKLSTGVKLAIGCGILALLSLGTCMGGAVWCGHKVTSGIASIGDREWKDLRNVANDLGTDEGAKAAYAAHPGLAQAYPTAEDFVGAVHLWRPSLEPLPEQMPSLFSGKVNAQASAVNGQNHLVLGYRMASGKSLTGTWDNGQLIDLVLE